MSPQLPPIPSKAALRALRGLVLGTSCTLALITEDRRRRINHAIRIVENGQRVKSAKNYRAGGELAPVLALEEDLWLDSSFLNLRPEPPRLPVDSRPPEPTPTIPIEQNIVAVSRQNDGQINPHVAGVVSSASDARLPVTAKPFQPPKTLQTKTGPGILDITMRPPWGVPNRKTLEEYRFPSNDEIVAMVHEASRIKQSSLVDRALQCMVLANGLPGNANNHDKQWMEAMALLCRTCQELGRLADATKLLAHVVSRGELDETDYFSFEPLSLINSLLAQASTESKEEYRETINTCTSLFLARFKEKPGKNPQAYEVAKSLLKAKFAVDTLIDVPNLYWRGIGIGEECDYEFTTWTIKELQTRGGYKFAIRLFLANYPKLSPSKDSINEMAEVIVKCVEDGHNHKPRPVLRTLLQLFESRQMKMRTDWAIKLLHSYWKSHPYLDDVEAFFDQLVAAGLHKVVFNPGGVCRIMVEIALEAGDEAKANHYIALGCTVDERFARNPRLHGLLARFHAAAGNWEGVKKEFESMNKSEDVNWGGGVAKVRGDAFVPVLKMYAADHTKSEIEQFVRLYTGELRVPISPYLVTLVARLYGSVRDFKSLGQWLLYCHSAAPQVDSKMINNAILASCRKSQMPFRDLRSLFRRLRLLNSDSIDKDTEKVMLQSALSASKHGGILAKGRMLSLQVETTKMVKKGRCASEVDVRLAMKESLVCGRPAKALSMYKRAIHLGMPRSDQSLRLAVWAALKLKEHGHSIEECLSTAWEQIKYAQEKGTDTNGAVNFLMSKSMRMTMDSDSRAEVFQRVKWTLERYERSGLRISSESFDQAALTCLEASHFKGALFFASKAAERMGQGPCYNTANFRILMLAYAELVDVQGIRDTVARVLQSHFKEDKIVRRTLREARRRISDSVVSDASQEWRGQARQIVQYGINKVVGMRKKLLVQRSAFEEMAVGIMAAAAAQGAESEGVVSVEAPWMVPSEPCGQGVKGDGQIRLRMKEQKERVRTAEDDALIAALEAGCYTPESTTGHKGQVQEAVW